MSDSHDSRRIRGLASLTEGLEPDAALEDDVVLAAAAEATRELDASRAFDSAIMRAIELEHVAQRTDEIAPVAAITDAVMARVAPELVASKVAADEAEAPRSGSPWTGVVRSARAALVAAAAVAAGTVLYAGYVEESFDSDVLANVGMVEVGDE